LLPNLQNCAAENFQRLRDKKDLHFCFCSLGIFMLHLVIVKVLLQIRGYEIGVVRFMGTLECTS